jgi:hypothetical protein
MGMEREPRVINFVKSIRIFVLDVIVFYAFFKNRHYVFCLYSIQDDG